MDSLSDEDVFNIQGTKDFLQEFFEINGFNIKGIDYDKDIDITELKEKYLPNGF